MNEPIEFKSYEPNQKLCPKDTLDEYINRTKALREKQGTSKLFLSFVSLHKPVLKDTTARWVGNMLNLAGIDTENFKPHSKRAASKASKGASLEDILSMGKLV